MAKLTTQRAAADLRYLERELAKGSEFPDRIERLESIRAHRLAFLHRSKCCRNCGRAIENPESLRLWAQDFLGPDCREALMEKAS